MKEKLDKYLVPLSIIIAGLLVAGSVLLSNQKLGPIIRATPSPNATQPPAADGTEIKANIPIQGQPVLGNDSAKVTMIEFSDFQCPFCARYNQETFPQIKSRYVDTGKVKVIFKNFPLTAIHNYAQGAAEAADCAFEQGKFWEYKEKLFENQNKLEKENLKKYAQELGLDTAKFNSCVDSGKYQSQVASDITDGRNAGINGTPAFVINGTLISGAYPFSEFERVINEKLGAK